MMKSDKTIHYLMHVPFEGPGCIIDWAKKEGYDLIPLKMFSKTALPSPGEVNNLVIMGGPMGVRDEEEYPWFKAEKEFIRQVISQNSKVLGICLGAQVIAGILGAEVYKNEKPEIGWFPVNFTSDGIKIFNSGKQMNVFHWHGDTFDLPKGARHLAFSKVTPNQAFSWNDHVLGIQFHLEITSDSMKKMLIACADQVEPSEFIQEIDQIKKHGASFIEAANKVMFSLLDCFFNNRK